MKWFLDRARERSTWAGLVAVLGAAGVALKPELKEAIITAGVALAGLVYAMTGDK